jgi:hypothetical protein
MVMKIQEEIWTGLGRIFIGNSVTLTTRVREDILNAKNRLKVVKKA